MMGGRGGGEGQRRDVYDFFRIEGNKAIPHEDCLLAIARTVNAMLLHCDNVQAFVYTELSR